MTDRPRESMFVVLDRVAGVPFFIGRDQNGRIALLANHKLACLFETREQAEKIASVVRAERKYAQVLPLSSVCVPS